MCRITQITLTWKIFRYLISQNFCLFTALLEMDTVIQCSIVSYMDLMMEIVVIRNMKTGTRDVVGVKDVIVLTKIIAISRIWKISAKMKLWWNSVTMIVEFLMMKFHLFGLCFWHMKHFSKNCTLWKFNTFPATQIILQFKAICFSQCGNFRIFLSFRFYIKLINFRESSETTIIFLHFSNAEFWFHGFFAIS